MVVESTVSKGFSGVRGVEKKASAAFVGGDSKGALEKTGVAMRSSSATGLKVATGIFDALIGCESRDSNH